MATSPQNLESLHETRSLEPRREPQQARSRVRLERILDATGELLGEIGVDGLSTRMIAARAGVNVATIYQFFPNKYAVIAALVERTAEQLLRRHEELAGSIDLRTPLREANERMMGGFVTAILEIPGFFTLRRAMQALPELSESQAVEERTKRAIGRRIMERLQMRRPDLDEVQRETIAQTIIQMTLSMLELSTEVPENRREAVLNELRTMMISYLSHYVGKEAPPPPAAGKAAD